MDISPRQIALANELVPSDRAAFLCGDMGAMPSPRPARRCSRYHVCMLFISTVDQPTERVTIQVLDCCWQLHLPMHTPTPQCILGRESLRKYPGARVRDRTAAGQAHYMIQPLVELYGGCMCC